MRARRIGRRWKREMLLYFIFVIITIAAAVPRIRAD
jgi:hypothetical protein